MYFDSSELYFDSREIFLIVVNYISIVAKQILLLSKDNYFTAIEIYFITVEIYSLPKYITAIEIYFTAIEILFQNFILYWHGLNMPPYFWPSMSLMWHHNRLQNSGVRFEFRKSELLMCGTFSGVLTSPMPSCFRKSMALLIACCFPFISLLSLRYSVRHNMLPFHNWCICHCSN